MKQQKKTIVAGHICLDITPVFPLGKTGDKSINTLGNIFASGKLINVDAADIHTGGAVANTGLAMKKLGAEVLLMGKVGVDNFGSIVLDILKQHNAKDGIIMDASSNTSYSVVIAPPGIDRIFLHHPGANDTFTSADIKPEMLEGISHFHFGYPPLMKNMYEEKGNELVELFRKVKQSGLSISLDMAAVDPESDAGAADWNTILNRVLPFVDFFLPSIEELGFMMDKKLYRQWEERAGGEDITEIISVQDEVMPLAGECIRRGAKVVVVKCGTPGLYYCSAEKGAAKEFEYMGLCPDAWCGKAGFEKSYIPERVMSGTGAGDVSIAGFLTAMLSGCGLEDCMHMAAACGASCVTEYDALGGLKLFDELLEQINNGWQKL